MPPDVNNSFKIVVELNIFVKSEKYVNFTVFVNASNELEYEEFKEII